MTIHIHRRDRAPEITTPFLKGLLRIICAGLACPDAHPPEIHLTLLSNEEMQQINFAHRGKNQATDVLSFSQVEGVVVPHEEGRAHVWGDVLVATEVARAQALERHETLHVEITRLIVHGVLHLLGHDHVEGGAQARRMKRWERKLFTLVSDSSRWPSFQDSA